MKTDTFTFDLPEGLIASHPPAKRSDSRLMVVDVRSETILHKQMCDLPGLLPPKSIMVFNKTKVRQCRLFGESKDTSGKIEFLFLQNNGGGEWEARLSRSKKQRPGKEFLLPGDVTATILFEKEEGIKVVRLSPPPSEGWFEKFGHIPLPPYIKRRDSSEDRERYQPVYAADIGSAAAPTAGLHFSEDLLGQIRERGIGTEFVTLHVGMGTFAPIRSEKIEDHQMHSEEYSITEECSTRLNNGKEANKKIIAVGTTSARTLESVAKGGRLSSATGSTSLYITPGYTFRFVDHLFTNFHTPRSSLLVMVSAFAGLDLIKAAYEEAVKERYRFFSYGDAMLLLS